MADRKKGGRVTAKKSSPGSRPTSQPSAGRYTPPIPREQKVSPWWVPALMFLLLGLGVITIFLNYVNLLPGDASNGYLLLGLLFITGGFVVATNYH